jgi:hypothetical protein
MESVHEDRVTGRETDTQYHCIRIGARQPNIALDFLIGVNGIVCISILCFPLKEKGHHFLTGDGLFGCSISRPGNFPA